MELTPSVERHPGVAGRGEQWMREVDPIAVELDHALLLGRLDVLDDAGCQWLEQRHRGGGEGSDCNERVADSRRQGAQPLRDKGAQAVRERDVRAVEADRAPGDRTPQLEREERVPTGDLVQSDQLGTRQA